MKEISHLIKNRHIRLFISSTFEDMQDERNYLMRRTFPKLQLMAAERNVMLTAIDLRWGITKEEAENGRVIDACFKEIENSIPFFIGIIGNRYGWCPTSDQIDKETTNRFPVVDELLGLSMTEMEIQFAVLRRKAKMHAYFYIKESVENKNDSIEDETKRQKLAALKKALVNNKRYKAQPYLNEEDLSNKITDAFKSLLDTLFKQPIVSPTCKELIRQRAYRDQLCNTYIKDDESFSFLSNWLSGTKKHLVIFGESGIGKSALLANWTKELEGSKDCEYNIIYHFIGNGGCEGLIEQIQRVLVERFYQVLNIKSQVRSDNQNENLLEEVITRVAERQDIKILLVLDGINQLIEDEAKSLSWVPELPCNMKVVFSTLREDRTMSTFKNRRYPRLELKSVKNKHQLIQEYLGTFAKKLSEKQIARIAADPQTDNTLVLVSLLNILINFCTHENLDITIENLLASETIDDYYKSLINIYECEYDGNVKTQGLVRSALSLILLSRSGISEYDLISVIKTTPFYWSQFFCAFKRNFSVCNGYITLSHQYISKAVSELYFQNPGWENDCRRALISSLINRNDEYAMKEVPFQYYCLRDNGGLYTYISDIDIFDYLYENDKIMLIKYWQNLGRDFQYSIRNFIDKLRTHEKSFEFEKLIRLSDFCSDDMNLYNEALLVLELGEKSAKTLIEQELLYNRLEIACHNCGDYNKSLEYCKLYLKLAVSNNGYRSLAGINALNDLGVSYFEAKDYKNAVYPFLNAIRITKALFGEASEKLIKLYNNLSTLFEEFEDYNNTFLYYNAALKIEEDKYNNVDFRLSYNDEYDLQTANTLESAASYFYSSGKSKKAIKYYRLALKILHNIYGRYHLRIANIHSKLAEISELSLDDSSVAVKEYLKAASIIKYLYGEKSVDYAIYIRKAGNYSEGITKLNLWTKSLQLSIELLGESDPWCLELYMSIAQYYLKEELEYSYARSIFNKILLLCEPVNFPPASRFKERVNMWRLICINQEYVLSISDKIKSVIKNMPSYVEHYKIKKGEEYFSDLEKYDRLVRRKLKIKGINDDVYILTIYFDWIQLQGSKSRLPENRKKYQLMIGIDLDSDRWLSSRICGTSIELVRGSFLRIQRFVHSLSDNELNERVLSVFSEKIMEFFTGEL